MKPSRVLAIALPCFLAFILFQMYMNGTLSFWASKISQLSAQEQALFMLANFMGIAILVVSVLLLALSIPSKEQLLIELRTPNLKSGIPRPKRTEPIEEDAAPSIYEEVEEDKQTLPVPIRARQIVRKNPVVKEEEIPQEELEIVSKVRSRISDIQLYDNLQVQLLEASEQRRAGYFERNGQKIKEAEARIDQLNKEKAILYKSITGKDLPNQFITENLQMAVIEKSNETQTA